MIAISVYNRVHNEIVDYIKDDYEIHDLNGTTYYRLKNYPGYYCSEDGEILSMINEKNMVNILKPWTNQYGHQYVWLVDKNGVRKKVLVHRAIAEELIPNLNNDPIVRHSNDIPYDNSITNLEWGTQKDNVEDCRRNGYMYMRKVYCYENDTTYDSCNDAAKDLNAWKSEITNCCRGKIESVRGYHLCYLEDKDNKMAHLNSWILQNGNFKPIVAKNIKDGCCLYFNSRKEAAEYLDINDSGISNVLANRITHYGDWTFYEPGEEEIERCY